MIRPTVALAAVILVAGLIGVPNVARAQLATTGPAAEVCKDCHANSYATFKAHKHGTKADARAPANLGECASCHGNGTEHVKAGGGRGVGGIVNPGSKSMASDAANGVCLTCHQGGSRIHWQTSAHATRDTTCASCHQIHTTHDKVRDKQAQTEVCFSCHKEQRAEMNRPSRHPVREGKVACSDCHNPHGGAGEKMLVRDNVNDTCYTCHMEKRGPFVRTHAPVQENCAICHNPHGTTNENLLKVRAPFLCQSCHEPTSHRGNMGTPTVGAGTSVNLLARGCVNCHTNIHGTNNVHNDAADRSFRR
jgi:DmsE family decaheme c-type cytochrome